jgi:pimeloyl-ACP methyl ester carboxylesterase
MMIGLAAGGLALTGAAQAIPAMAAPASAPKTIRLGKVTLDKCGSSPLTYCGGMTVPLDYGSKASPGIHIGFLWVPAAKRNHPKGTVLAVEGGPGFMTFGSELSYLAMLGPLRQSRNLLLVNLRGTGNSTPVNCPGLESYNKLQQQDGPAFNALVGKCGDKLNHIWKYKRGGFVHASDLFNTAYSARDVSRVLSALRVGRVDLYGDSYGSWFAQVLAARYPQQFRSVTLDSTYQVLGLDPWYTSTVVTARQAFEQACDRWRPCDSAAGPGAWSRISKLAARLNKKPITGQTVSESGTLTKFTVNTETLVNLVNNAGFDPVVYRDLDAAARALLARGDQAPLLRLAALSVGFDDASFPLPEFSDGLYFAVACTDYVQLFSRTASAATRARQYRTALRREPSNTFAPFSVAQWTQLDQYTEAYSACLKWPKPTRLFPPITRRPPLVPPRLHVLILSGTFDSLTPWLDGATVVASQMGKSARIVRVANLTHVTLQDADDACPAQIFQTFLSNPGGLAHQNTSCAGRVAPIHAVGGYPLRLAQAQPARATAGNRAGRPALQAASTALALVGDEISRFPLLAGSDLALRGGKVGFSGGNVVKIRLTGARWVADATVSGTASWNQSSGFVTAKLTVTPEHGQPVTVNASWRAFAEASQLAVITGSQGGRRLAAVSPAP